jgi:hypothetical protein
MERVDKIDRCLVCFPLCRKEMDALVEGEALGDLSDDLSWKLNLVAERTKDFMPGERATNQGVLRDTKKQGELEGERDTY